MEPPPFGAKYIPLQNETNDLQGTIISINSEKPAPSSFNDNEGFGHIPNESKKTGVSTFNHTAREQKKKDLLHISLIKPNFNWKKFNFSITENTLEQYYNPPIPLFFRSNDEPYKEFQQFIYEDMMSDSEYESLTKDTFRYNKHIYLQTYAKTLNHFVTHLTKLHDPIDRLRNMDLNQDCIDTAYQCAKDDVKADYKLARTFLSNVFHVGVFEYGLLRFMQSKLYKNDPCCWCPCNKHLVIWRKQIGFDRNGFLHRDNVCNNTQYSPQGLIDHLCMQRNKCKVHKLLYLYCFYQYDGDSHKNKVSRTSSFTLINRYNLNTVKRYVYSQYFCL